MTESIQSFIALLQKSLQGQTWDKLVLSKYRGSEAQLKRVNIRPLELRGQPVLSLVYCYETNQVTHNLEPQAGIQLIENWLAQDFKSANFFASDQQAECEVSKKGKVRIKVNPLKSSTLKPQQHDRDKQRFVAQNRPFLTALGITDRQHQVVPAMSRKWKQINKFIEVCSGAMAETGLLAQAADNSAIQVVDFGSGKGYLTFALHDYLTHHKQLKAQVTGVELRQHLTDFCNQQAEKLEDPGLTFVCGDVQHHAPRHTDVMIALHACDVATDYAIHYGIRAGAQVIMCSPCCHKQLRPQMKAPDQLKPLLQYGVHLGQEAEMLTDAIRALLLEAYGYSSKIFEFVSLEHTNKNKMILALKRQHPVDREQILAEVRRLKAFYRVEAHCLESLLRRSSAENGEKTLP